MSKLSKTIGKFKLWGILAAVVIVAGIVIAAIFGFNTDAALSDSRTLSVRLDSYVTDDRTALIREVCEEEIGGAGLGDKYSMTSEFSGTGCEIVYAFSSSVDESAVAAVKTAVENRLTEATGTQGNALYGAYVYVTSNAETVSAVLPEGISGAPCWRASSPSFWNLSTSPVRYKLNMGIAAAASTLAGTLLTLALVALVRIPVTASVAYVGAFALLFTTILSLFAFGKMRADFKTDEYKEKSAEDAIVSSLPAKGILLFCLVAAVVLVVVGAIATAAVRWFAIASLIGVAAALYSVLLFLPSLYLPLKKASDKRAAARARYDYKSPREKKREAKAAAAAETQPAADKAE